ncbi:hypothetical protein [Helicobacter mesocricetorum]|uniref:hypothetical protein n=1 Tax=Helicobacter mesocricetorum TaxID=87012 RepID=UPI000CF0D9EA|nr:hypothetical protein [Helicobacter mesocricetorum]
MYSLDFYIFIWCLLLVALFPFIILCVAFVVYEKIRDSLENQKNREAKFKNIDYLISVLKGAPTAEVTQEILDAFTRYFIPFGDISKESKEYQGRMDFISAFALCSSVDIDNVVRHREELVKSNPNFKKEIETTIGSALKTRESEKKKK